MILEFLAIKRYIKKKLSIRLISLLITPYLGWCLTPPENQEGSFFYQNNVTDISQYNLSTMVTKKISRPDFMMSSAYIGNMNNGELLVTDYDNYNQGRGAIFKLNFNTGKSEYIAPGNILGYFARVNKIFYLDDTSIVSADYLDDILINKKKLVHSSVPQKTIAMIDDTHFVFDDDYNPGKVFLYNDRTDNLSHLPIKNCYVQLYRKKNKQLICENDNKFFATSLDGKVTQEIPALKKFFGLTFIDYFPIRDEMVFSILQGRIFGGEELRYYSYNFSTNQAARLIFH